MKTECSKKVVGYKIKNINCEEYGNDCFLEDGSFTASKENAEIYPMSFVEWLVGDLRKVENELKLPYKHNYSIKVFPVWGEA